jgi:hypothetical protein
MGLLDAVLGKPSAVCCPNCGGAHFVTKLPTLDVAGEKIPVYRCRDKDWTEFARPAAPGVEPAPASCQLTTWAVMPDGHRVLGRTTLAEDVKLSPPDHAVHGFIERRGVTYRVPTEAEILETLKTTIGRMLRERAIAATKLENATKYCQARTCVAQQDGREIRTPFCGLCGTPTGPKYLGRGVCRKDGCKLKNVPAQDPAEAFCGRCGTAFEGAQR